MTYHADEDSVLRSREQKRELSPFVRVHLGLLADKVREAAADTLDGGQRVLHLRLSSDPGSLDETLWDLACDSSCRRMSEKRLRSWGNSPPPYTAWNGPGPSLDHTGRHQPHP